jgi:hypothetical protein
MSWPARHLHVCTIQYSTVQCRIVLSVGGEHALCCLCAFSDFQASLRVWMTLFVSVWLVCGHRKIILIESASNNGKFYQFSVSAGTAGHLP